jgi:hypothetical protein
MPRLLVVSYLIHFFLTMYVDFSSYVYGLDELVADRDSIFVGSHFRCHTFINKRYANPCKCESLSHFIPMK